jgi:hypothetical protein
MGQSKPPPGWSSRRGQMRRTDGGGGLAEGSMLQTPAWLSKDRCADLATTIRIGFRQTPRSPWGSLLIAEVYRRFAWGRCQHRMSSDFTGPSLIWACPNARRPNGIRHGVAKRDPTQAALQLIGAGCEPSRCANTPRRRVWRCGHHLRVCSAVCSSRDHS